MTQTRSLVSKVAGSRLARVPSVAGWMLGFAAPASAMQAQTAFDIPPSVIFVTADVQHDLGADLDDAGDVSVTRTNATVGFHRRFDDDWVLRGQVGAEHAHYSWSSGALFLGSGDPWSEIWKLGAGVQLIRKLDEQWSVEGSFTAISTAEPDAELSDSLDYRLRLAGIWRRDEDLTLGLELTASTHLEDSTLVLPFPRVNWQFSQDWRLISDIGDVIQGPSVGVHHTFSDAFTLGAVAMGVYNDARLADGVTPDGVMRETRISAGIEAKWSPRLGIELSLLCGYDVWGEIQVDDAVGDEIASTDLDPAPLFGLSASVAF